ncbi:hypothetical protein DPMN_083137 [Dreissena polymorpha]|uniref:Uncharacterized protein n=1 Tax=Dreissena polymorpha TaxID=45954 RepID=A0A9D4BI46_DREPO|nr:hypothetical protein DPMN_083137 [Dreissena polymorpha]
MTCCCLLRVDACCHRGDGLRKTQKSQKVRPGSSRFLICGEPGSSGTTMSIRAYMGLGL